MASLEWNRLRAEWRAADGGRRFRIVFAGDLCPSRAGERLATEGRVDGVFRAVRPFLDTGDLRIVQWETPLARTESPIRKSGPNLNASPDCAVFADGFDVALLANNHIGDHGASGVRDTLDFLRARGVATVGAGLDRAEAEKPLFVECAGLRVAILNYAENEFGLAGDDRPGAAPQSPSTNRRAVRAAADDADLVVVALHGGHEHNPFPSPRLRDLCRAFVDAGAAMVFNCHTHCPEGVEVHDGAPIVYSPGNFYFPSFKPGRLPVWRTGYLTACDFDARGAFALELLPFRFDAEAVTPLDTAERALFEEYLERLNAPLGDPARLRAYFEAWASNPQWNYYGSLAAPSPEWRDDDVHSSEAFRRLMQLRNLFTCESHTDVLRTALRLVEEGRVASASRLRGAISVLQHPAWMVHGD